MFQNFIQIGLQKRLEHVLCRCDVKTFYVHFNKIEENRGNDTQINHIFIS